MTAPDAFSFEEGPCIPADHAGYDLLPRCRGEGGDVSVLFWPTGWTSTPWTSVVQSAKAASGAAPTLSMRLPASPASCMLS